MKDQKFSIAKRLASFRFAFSGLKAVLREEHNVRVHFVLAFIVVVSGFLLQIRVSEWLFVVMAIGLVIASEIVNSAVENIADFVHPGQHDKIKKIKDISAASVLIASITALVVGLVVFVPKVFRLLGQAFPD